MRALRESFMQVKNRRLTALIIASAAFSVHAAKPGGGGGTPQPPRAVATFESLGVYWAPGTNAGAAGCQIQYRKQGDTAWKPALAMWYDARNGECRGSLVQLAPGTAYEIQVGLPGQAFQPAIVASTWADTTAWPTTTVNVAGGGQTLAITQGGTASNYLVYD